MSSGALDSLIRAITTIFVLSLAVERMASLFKGRDLQPLRPRRASLKSGLRVNLAHSSVVHIEKHIATPVADLELRRAHIRAVITENTIFLGMGLALLTGANAFEGLPGVGNLSKMLGFGGSTSHYLLSLPGILLTGAAAAIGSSFWYDLLGILMEVRRTKQAITTSTEATATPGADLTALKDQSLLFRSRHEEARKQLQKWIEDGVVAGAEVADILEDPYLEIRVQPVAGKATPQWAEVTVGGVAIKIPVRVQKKK